MKKQVNIEQVITIEGLCKSFGSLDILRGVDLQVCKGENVVVLGKSGAGKSVLIKLIVGLLSYDKGSIKVLDQEVRELPLKALNELRLHIGFSFQSSALYDSMTVRQNLAFPLQMNKPLLSRKEIDKDIDEVLDAVGLREKLHVMPADLSGGQRKRIGIARTLILKPQIMLYDEPTSGLDPMTSGEINELIRDVQRRYNTSAIVITHDLTTARDTGDKVAMLLDGVFVKVGSFEELAATKNDAIQHFFNYNYTQ